MTQLRPPTADGVLVMLQRDAVGMLPTRRGLALGLAVLMVVGLVGLGASTGRADASGSLTSFTDPDGGFLAMGIASGPDGALWFTTEDGIGRITTNGTVTSYAVGVGVSSPSGSGAITLGPDGALWFTTEDGIGRITTSGVVTTYPSGGLFEPAGITTGPDGDLWFTAENGVGRITTAGVVTTYSVGVPVGGLFESPGITTGPDGALWFATRDGIGRITTSGVVTTYPSGGLFEPAGITSGPDGALWFTAENGIGRITPAGSVTTYPVGVPIGGPLGPGGITVGPDGALWFGAEDAIGRITTSGVVTTISDPSIEWPTGVTTGPDGAMWFTNLTNSIIDRIAVAEAASAVPTVPSRVAGQDPITSALAVSQSQFPTAGSAHAVVLARADDPADALAGVPLAVKVGGPILLTPTDSLDGQTATEISRVLTRGGTVYLLGGSSALSDTVESAVTALGDVPVRLGGLTRAATAVDVAQQGLGNPTVIFEVDGFATQDAVSAGVAAAVTGGAVLLTEGGALPTESAAYLAAHPGDTRYGVGAAAGADPAATAISGDSPDATSVLIAQRFFPTAAAVGFAGDTDAAGAITAGPFMAKMGGPLLFVPLSDGLPDPVRTYLTTLTGRATTAYVFGGSSSISDEQLSAIQGAL